MRCSHKVRGKLIEIPGKDGKMFGTPEYEPDYEKLAKIAIKLATGVGKDYFYLEYFVCYQCHKILKLNNIFT